MNRRNKTESANFLYCRFSLFLKDPFLQIVYMESSGKLHDKKTPTKSINEPRM